MADYIKREGLISKFKQLGFGTHSLIEQIFAEGVYAVIDEFPADDVESVRHGRWESCFEDYRQQIEGNKCSACGFTYYGTGVSCFNFCPGCGARMEENNG